MPRCAACGSKRVVIETDVKQFADPVGAVAGYMLGGVLLGAYMSTHKQKKIGYHCLDCGQILQAPLNGRISSDIDRYLSSPQLYQYQLSNIKKTYPNIEWNEQTDNPALIEQSAASEVQALPASKAIENVTPSQIVDDPLFGQYSEDHLEKRIIDLLISNNGRQKLAFIPFLLHEEGNYEMVDEIVSLFVKKQIATVSDMEGIKYLQITPECQSDFSVLTLRTIEVAIERNNLAVERMKEKQKDSYFTVHELFNKLSEYDSAIAYKHFLEEQQAAGANIPDKFLMAVHKSADIEKYYGKDITSLRKKLKKIIAEIEQERTLTQ